MDGWICFVRNGRLQDVKLNPDIHGFPVSCGICESVYGIGVLKVGSFICPFFPYTGIPLSVLFVYVNKIKQTSYSTKSITSRLPRKKKFVQYCLYIERSIKY